jgi:hypothetical protein
MLKNESHQLEASISTTDISRTINLVIRKTSDGEDSDRVEATMQFPLLFDSKGGLLIAFGNKLVLKAIVKQAELNLEQVLAHLQQLAVKVIYLDPTINDKAVGD